MDYDSTALPTELPRPGYRGVRYTSGRGDVSSAATRRLSVGVVLNCQERGEVDLDKAKGSCTVVFHPRDLAGKFAGWAAGRLHHPGEAVPGLKTFKPMGHKTAHRPV